MRASPAKRTNLDCAGSSVAGRSSAADHGGWGHRLRFRRVRKILIDGDPACLPATTVYPAGFSGSHTSPRIGCSSWCGSTVYGSPAARDQRSFRRLLSEADPPSGALRWAERSGSSTGSGAGRR